MDTKKTFIAVLALLLVGSLGYLIWDNGNAADVVEWDDTDVVAVQEGEENFPGEDLQANDVEGNVERAEVGGSEGSVDPDEARPLITVTGRIVTKLKAPVAEATVNLSAQGRGRRSRITKEVTTKSDGTFTFSGKGFSRMWVTLNVKHDEYTIATAFKNFNNAAGSLDMGDITVYVGGTVIGSVTDMQGNIISNAEATLSSMDRGRWRFGGSGGGIPAAKTNSNGVFQIDHVAPGRYRVNAVAPHRQRQSEGPITVIDEQTERLDPIQLGPGFELKGIVFRPDGKPLEGAAVRVRGEDRRSRGQDKKTDEQGEFAFDHLAPGKYSVRVEAEGYLDNNEHPAVEVTQAPPLTITMEQGLMIEGLVVDAVTGQPVTSYGARVQRVGGLPDPEADRKREESRRMFEELRTLREAKEPTAQQKQRLEQLMAQMRELGGRGGFGRGRGGTDGGGRGGRGGGRGGTDGGGRGAGRGGTDGGRGRGGRDGGGGRRGRGGFGEMFGRNRNGNLPGDTGEVKDHPGGHFQFTGLQEGIWVVDIGSPDHQKLRSQRIELRKGDGAPKLNLTAQRGLLVQGSVMSKTDRRPLANANIELRVVLEEQNTGNNARGGNTRGGTDGGSRRASMFRQFQGSGPRTTRILGARTARDGSFKIKNAPPGKYVIRAEADGYSQQSTEPFDLKTDSPELALELGALATLEGRVSGIPAGKIAETKVMAYSLPRNFRDADVNPDGTYKITGLEPGDYIVRAFIGDARRYIFRQMFRGFSATGDQSAENKPDIKVREGGEHRFNVVVTQKTTGTVKGEVMANGNSATGYRVSLRKVDDGSGGQETGGFRGFGRMGNSSSVDQKGGYEIRDVEMGQYTLTVSPSSGRRGRGGSEVARTMIFVHAESVTQVPLITVEIGSLTGTITMPAEEKPPEGATPSRNASARITLYKGVSAVPDPSQPGQEEIMRFSARSRDGKFEFQTLPTGDYLMQLRVIGRDVITKSIYVGAGEKTKIAIEAGKRRPPETKKAPAAKKPAEAKAGK